MSSNDQQTMFAIPGVIQWAGARNTEQGSRADRSARMRSARPLTAAFGAQGMEIH